MSQMGESLQLALELEGRVKPAPENEQLVRIAGILANLPEPEIDASFMLALEQRLLAEEVEEAPAGLHVVPDSTDAPAVDSPRAPVVQMPKRRFTVRRSVVAVAAAASLTAFPVVAAAQSLPGSPFYGLKTAIENIKLAVFGTPMEDALTYLSMADTRMTEAERLIALGAEPTLVEATIAKAEGYVRTAQSIVMENAADATTLLRLGEAAANTEARLRSVRASIATTDGTIDDAIDTMIAIQDAVNSALGLLAIESPAITQPQSDPFLSRSGSSTSTSSNTSSGHSKATTTDTSDEHEVAPTPKEISEAAEGCQVPLSDVGGDATAPVARIMCTY